MKLTKAQLRVLGLLAEGPITEPGVIIHRIKYRTLLTLQEAGLVRYYPYGKPPTWALTPHGKKFNDPH